MKSMVASMELFGNPSSCHSVGLRAKSDYESNRLKMAQLINANNPSEIVILSGGTESINYCLRGAALHARDTTSGGGNHIITSVVEHVAVLETVKYLVSIGFEATFVPVDSEGKVSAEAVARAITPATVLCTIMHSNNEVGTINPIAEIAQELKKARIDCELPSILFHCDTSQSLGKVDVDVQQLGVDYATITSHKLYGPKGIGALYVRSGTPPLKKLIFGAGHENGQRAGTENTILAAGLGTACEVAKQMLPSSEVEMRVLRDRLQDKLIALSPDPATIKVNGCLSERLPNTLSISFADILAPLLLEQVQHRIAASAGAACHSHEDTRVSYVLSEMGVPLKFARGTIRLSVGRSTTEKEVDEAAMLISDAVAFLRSH